VDELDRILANDRPPEPSPRFVDSVMAAVAREHALPPPLPFPWRRMAAGAGAGVMAVAVAVMAGPRVGVSPVAARIAEASTTPGIALAIVAVSGALLFSWLAVRLSQRLAASPR